MSTEVPGIREISAQRPSFVNSVADFAKGLNINEKGAALVKEVVGLLASEPSLRVTNATVNQTKEVGRPIGATGTPQLDNPNDEIAKEIDGAIIFMKICGEMNEKGYDFAKDRLNTTKNLNKAHHENTMKDMKKSFEEMDAAAKSNKFSSIFGWLCAAIAVVIAVAVSVASGGIAVGPAVGALIAIAGCVLNQTGATQKITEAIAKGLEKLGMSKQAAQITAQIAFTVALMVAAIACGRIDGVVKLGELGKNIAQLASAIASATKSIMIGAGVGSALMGGFNAKINYDALMAQKDLIEDDKFMAFITRMLEENSEEIQEILSTMNGVAEETADILSSETDTMNAIAMNIGQKA